MKFTLSLSALLCAAFTTSALAFPTPAEPFFVSRMVKRQVAHDDSAPVPFAASTCGQYALREPQKLHARSYNDSTTTFLSVSVDDTEAPILTALPSTSGAGDAYEFDFQTCNYTGFTQGFSRNSGGSMGAPIEFWGRVVTNTTSLTTNTTQQQCLSATASSADSKDGVFNFASCNDTDSKQWFRLQEGVGGAVLTYFPVKNETGYEYKGQIPEYFKVDLHRHEKDFNAVEYTDDNSQQYVQFY